MDPWFNERVAGIVGGVLGGGIGTVFGGIGGPLMGTLMSRGKGRPVVFGMLWGGLVFGTALLITAVVALLLDQPWYIAFAFGLPGLVVTPLMGILMPVARRGYRMAEERALAAEEIRRG